jgi:hypothetical protein
MTVLTDLANDYITCRARRHRWQAISDPGTKGLKYRESRSVFRLASECDRCGAIREEAWNRLTGEILFVGYSYPQAYVTKGKGRILPKAVRKEYIKRLAS